ncbi:hypothetical protein Tco_1466216 [Tanacetum coccineum]
MKDVFESTENDLSATWKQNELLNDQLLEAKLKHEIECCVLLRLKVVSSVRRPLNKDSSFKNSALSNTKKSSEKVEVSNRTNKKTDVASTNVVQIVLWIVDSGCSKHMTGDHSLLKNFVEKFIGMVRFKNDHFAAITGSGQFYDGALEVAFHSKTCYVRNLEGDDLLTGARESNLYTISIFDMATSSPVCLLSKATSTKS